MSAIVANEVIPTEIEECPECLMGNLNWLLAQAHYALASELAAAFEPLGLTPRGHAVLAAGMTGSHTQKQLAEIVGVDKTTMVVTLMSSRPQVWPSASPPPTTAARASSR